MVPANSVAAVLILSCLRGAAPSAVLQFETVPSTAEGHGVATNPLAECLDVPHSFCLTSAAGATSTLVSPLATKSDLVLWYQFDKSLPVDDSGHRRHLTDANSVLSPLTVGPGLLGQGGSAHFDGRTGRVVAGGEDLSTEAFTVTLWLYLLEDSVGGWRTIFSRGSDAEQLAPALLLRPDERRLHVRASPAGADGGALDSTGILPLRRWTHVAVVCTGSVLRLYVNGLKDGEVILESPPSSNAAAALNLGKDPWRAGTKAFLDDFRWYAAALTPPDIKALAYASLTGMGSDFVQLGCTSCKFTEAVSHCGERHHLCSVQELFSGGLHTARTMGWLSTSPEVWYHTAGATSDSDHFDDTEKLGLCCAN